MPTAANPNLHRMKGAKGGILPEVAEGYQDHHRNKNGDQDGVNLILLTRDKRKREQAHTAYRHGSFLEARLRDEGR